ncbi:carboxy terminal-processing peptidase [Larsenimonas rhizosphaerae]|uniref:Carboxy terminal-processing peptidase n=1 Tax=Larsenimonas rhizosphaerae TaxID=2944682 RepID=A0AA41ZH83_9GAMM|nr:carboxy terminal-processing peptidase [Larsenimonas rhizosphaerae]MCM2131128.1 carboxy terminal-processing peptidase [Larsenimonas rhizosphaerae]MCX2523833.1 carboxy terminal-processing peptidase [Larsenimonas rhizosphaerae]
MSPRVVASQLAITLLWLAFSLPASAAPITSTSEQQQASREVSEALRYGHYDDVTMDQAWSKRAFERLLKLLDPQHVYLLESDINEFSGLEDSFGDDIKEGNLDPIYAFYDRFQDRLEARLNYAINQLRQKPVFDFSGNERMVLDREDSDWAASSEELDALWDKRIKNSALTMSLSNTADDDIVKQLLTRYENQLNRIRQTKSEDVMSVIMSAVTGSIDPHTEYLSPSQGESFDIQMKLSLEGIGALLQSENEYVKVASLVPGGPADKGGALKPADRIVAVGQGEDGEMTNVIGMRLDDVVDLIRGAKGSIVRLEIIPAKAVDVTQTHVIKIKRDTVKLEDQAAKSQIVTLERDGRPVKVGVITVPAFYVDFEAWQAGRQDYRSTTRDVRKLIEKLKDQDVEGIVLDLRNDGGGALQEANSMIGLFIDRGPTVQVRDARGRISLYGDTDRGVAYDGPLAVLVNRLSASASEIFAGAIQDYGRGIIVGTRTFGKGTVQTMSDLSHGELKMTRAKFYRITGKSTQMKGVTPDISFPSMLDSEEIGESALDNALPWDTVRPVNYRRYGNPARWMSELEKRHEQRASNDPNFRYLEQEARLARKLREQTSSVSLNKRQRKNEMDAQEAEQLSLENQRRRALKLPEIKDWTDSRDDKDSATPIDEAELNESAAILYDYHQLMQDQ